ncbi:MAG: ABC transporter ATP-binding protein [Thermodesulfobacteriota bacterium]
MSDNQKKPAIVFKGVGKKYPLFPNRGDVLRHVLGLDRLPFWRKNYHAFWALRDINFELAAGSRLGIVGRNGAGKTTLLKLVTGNIQPSEGEALVNGQIQALLSPGAWFHPEFTGVENIRASLTYQGLSPDEIEAAIRDIAAFTELGSFLEQPLKTYSGGMEMRLIFATATAIKPDILIIDEMLSAGDAYFSIKSGERMANLVAGGASVLIVSHNMQDVVRYCDEAIWMERGRIILRGSSLDVVKAYMEFIHQLEDRRLKAKNLKLRTGGYDEALTDGYGDRFNLDFQLEGNTGTEARIAELRLLKNGRPEESLNVGGPQDSNSNQAAWISLDGGCWSEPRMEDGSSWRSLTIETEGQGVAVGRAAFLLFIYEHDSEYEVQVRYRTSQAGRLFLTVMLSQEILNYRVALPESGDDWTEWSLRLAVSGTVKKPVEELQAEESSSDEKKMVNNQAAILSRWPGQGHLMIDTVRILGEDGREQAVFKAGSPLKLLITVKARYSGDYNIIPGASLFRRDGIMICQFVGGKFPARLEQGQKKIFLLDLGHLTLGDGYFLFSVAIYNNGLDWEKDRQDLIDRSYEFQVIENVDHQAICVCQLPGQWRLMNQGPAETRAGTDSAVGS